MIESLNKGNRRHELSWKTFYNRLCKHIGLKTSGIVTEVAIDNRNENRASSTTLSATMPGLQIRDGNRVSTSTRTPFQIRNDNIASPTTRTALQN